MSGSTVGVHSFFPRLCTLGVCRWQIYGTQCAALENMWTEKKCTATVESLACCHGRMISEQFLPQFWCIVDLTMHPRKNRSCGCVKSEENKRENQRTTKVVYMERTQLRYVQYSQCCTSCWGY